MTLLPLQHPARPAGHANSAKAHEYRGRYRSERGNETCGEFRLSAPDCVEGKPRIAMSERFDIPQTGNVYIRHGKRLGKICAVAIQHDNPRYSCSARGIQSRKREPANNTIQSSRPMVNEWSSPWRVMQEFRA